ncbi:hypothetical protein QCB44_07360 [Thiomicrorhabdus sp. zzn3]|uniref:hypothetical protein n=1 Tax=Thiomicrorhabdus sp. zzn3 TaxID=3039775 RepID=UPI002436F2B9|nr:hypothetical protein [Thiomicrorhabdus sp. zzn3]MDG6778517.1 hypothetical protein [Thiomicrorhabdus sp. zzn3]
MKDRITRWMAPLLNTTGLLLLLMLTANSHAQDFKPSSPVTALMPIVMDNLELLQLTPEQLDQVRAIARSNFAEVEFINAKYHDIKSELKENTLDGAGDKNHSLQLIQELSELDKKRMALTIECVFGLKQILTEEQYQEVISLLSFQNS